jgi:hypothetical protein
MAVLQASRLPYTLYNNETLLNIRYGDGIHKQINGVDDVNDEAGMGIN